MKKIPPQEAPECLRTPTPAFRVKYDEFMKTPSIIIFTDRSGA